MRLAPIVAVLGVLAAGCGELDRPAYSPRSAPRLPAPETPVASPVMQTPAPEPEPTASSGDTCGAAALSHLVGKNKRDIPVPVDPSRRRVACTTCPVTEDLRPWRLNIFYDQKTGVITEVRCG
jgi:hypothetical protein